MTVSSDHDLRYMRRALQLALKGVGRTSPNPAVGAVVVNNGMIVGEGWHRRAGTPHAEIHALRQAGEASRGGDLYVTLEPCSHQGRTPPCCQAVIAAGIGRVIAAMEDPNPLVSGRGMAALRAAGIRTRLGICEQEARLLNEPFCTSMMTGLPFVIMKSAATLDGWTATLSGDSRWVTGEPARKLVHRVRSRVDAVMVGVETVLADDPQLTCRHIRGKNPVRIVVDSHLRTPLNSQLVLTAGQIPTLVATLVDSGDAAAALEATGVTLLRCAESNGRVDLTDLLQKVLSRDIQSILLEGGATLAGSAVKGGLIDKVMLFYAPKLLCGPGIPMFAGIPAEAMNDALRLKHLTCRRVGEDILLEGYLKSSCLPV